MGNMPFEQFNDRMNELNPESNIVLVCLMGPMGDVSAALLADRGYARVLYAAATPAFFPRLGRYTRADSVG